LQLAKGYASEHKLEQRVQYRLGDFVEMSKSLDKVVYCDPAPKELIRVTLDCISRVIALTYPRKHLLGEICTKILNFGFWLSRSNSRNCIPESRLVHESINAGGFKRVFDRKSPI
jgi:hypothetical protein